MNWFRWIYILLFFLVPADLAFAKISHPVYRTSAKKKKKKGQLTRKKYAGKKRVVKRRKRRKHLGKKNNQIVSSSKSIQQSLLSVVKNQGAVAQITNKVHTADKEVMPQNTTFQPGFEKSKIEEVKNIEKLADKPQKKLVDDESQKKEDVALASTAKAPDVSVLPFSVLEAPKKQDDPKIEDKLNLPTKSLEQYVLQAKKSMNLWRSPFIMQHDGLADNAVTALPFAQLASRIFFGIDCLGLPLAAQLPFGVYSGLSVINVGPVVCLIKNDEIYSKLPECTRMFSVYEQMGHIKCHHDLRNFLFSAVVGTSAYGITDRVENKIFSKVKFIENHSIAKFVASNLSLFIASGIVQGAISHMPFSKSYGKQNKEARNEAVKAIIKLPDGENIIKQHLQWLEGKITELSNTQLPDQDLIIELNSFIAQLRHEQDDLIDSILSFSSKKN